MVGGVLDLKTAVLLFGWIPFWWAMAAVTLYRMRKNDDREDREVGSA